MSKNIKALQWENTEISFGDIKVKFEPSEVKNHCSVSLIDTRADEHKNILTSLIDKELYKESIGLIVKRTIKNLSKKGSRLWT